MPEDPMQDSQAAAKWYQAGRLNGCAVQAEPASLRRASRRSASKNESVSALLRSALAYWSGGQSACGRLNITLRYANRRAVTALAWLQWAGACLQASAAPARRFA